MQNLKSAAARQGSGLTDIQRIVRNLRIGKKVFILSGNRYTFPSHSVSRSSKNRFSYTYLYSLFSRYLVKSYSNHSHYLVKSYSTYSHLSLCCPSAVALLSMCCPSGCGRYYHVYFPYINFNVHLKVIIRLPRPPP